MQCMMPSARARNKLFVNYFQIQFVFDCIIIILIYYNHNKHYYKHNIIIKPKSIYIIYFYHTRQSMHTQQLC